MRRSPSWSAHQETASFPPEARPEKESISRSSPGGGAEEGLASSITSDCASVRSSMSVTLGVY